MSAAGLMGPMTARVVKSLAVVLFLLAAARPSHAAVALDACTSTDVLQTLGTSVSTTGETVGSGSNRALIAVLTWSAISTDPSGVTVIWDSGGSNQAMTLVADIRNTSGGGGPRAAIYAFVNPVSGNKTLQASWTGSVSATIAACAFIGVDQTGGTTSFYNATTATGTDASPAVSVSSAIGDYAIESGACCTSAGSFASPAQTQIFADNTPTAYAGAASYGAGAATVTFGWSLGASTNWAEAAVAIKAAGAAAPPHRMMTMGIGMLDAPPAWHRPQISQAEIDYGWTAARGGGLTGPMIGDRMKIEMSPALQSEIAEFETAFAEQARLNEMVTTALQSHAAAGAR